jgi:hypothetical protein
MAAQTNALYDEDQEWLANSGANAHITNELENLIVQQPLHYHQMVDVLKINNAGCFCKILVRKENHSNQS